MQVALASPYKKLNHKVRDENRLLQKNLKRHATDISAQSPQESKDFPHMRAK